MLRDSLRASICMKAICGFSRCDEWSTWRHSFSPAVWGWSMSGDVTSSDSRSLSIVIFPTWLAEVRLLWVWVQVACDCLARHMSRNYGYQVLDTSHLMQSLHLLSTVFNTFIKQFDCNCVGFFWPAPFFFFFFWYLWTFQTFVTKRRTAMCLFVCWFHIFSM